jgi:hypothetical protein
VRSANEDVEMHDAESEEENEAEEEDKVQGSLALYVGGSHLLFFLKR